MNTQGRSYILYFHGINAKHFYRLFLLICEHSPGPLHLFEC